MRMMPSVKQQMVRELSQKKQKKDIENQEIKQKQIENIIINQNQYDLSINRVKSPNQLKNKNNEVTKQRSLLSARKVGNIIEKNCQYQLDDKKNRVVSSVIKNNSLNRNKKMLQDLVQKENKLSNKKNMFEQYEDSYKSIVSDYKNFGVPVIQESFIGYSKIDQLELKNYNALQDNIQIQLQLFKLQQYNKMN